MSELPDYLEHVLEDEDHPINFYSFSYDANTAQFQIGSTFIPQVAFSPFRFQTDGIEPITNPKVMLTTPVLVNNGVGGPISTPNLRDWVLENADKIKEVIPVMYDVYKSLMDNPEDLPPLQQDHDTHMGFTAALNLHEAEYRGLHFQVLGNCACLGINPYGLMVKGVEKGFVEYDLHNADTNAQQISLFAGLGYLAMLADAPEQTRLF